MRVIPLITARWKKAVFLIFEAEPQSTSYPSFHKAKQYTLCVSGCKGGGQNWGQLVEKVFYFVQKCYFDQFLKNMKT